MGRVAPREGLIENMRALFGGRRRQLGNKSRDLLGSHRFQRTISQAL